MRFKVDAKKLLKNKITQLWLWIAVSCSLVGAFVIVTTELREARSGSPELITQIDDFPASFLAQIRSPKLNAIAIDLTALGSASVVTIFVFISAILLLLRRKHLIAAHLVASGVGSAFLTWALKSFFERPRPNGLLHLVDVQGYSYPSGHSLSSAAVYFTFAILLGDVFQKWRERIVIVVLATIFILLIGLSRVYLGVHYISDVFAGVSIGIGWASLLGAVRLLIEVRRSAKIR